MVYNFVAVQAKAGHHYRYFVIGISELAQAQSA